jgi:hypothetical protein
MMNNTIHRLLTQLEFGKPAVVDGMALIPIFGNHRCNVEYLTLDEAINSGSLRITEVSEGGSVPNLRAENLCDKPILLIDGEELIGAKQNRIINISILLKEKSTTTIPVSCVERGRWSYNTPDFKPSMNVMPPKARALKTKTVSESIEKCCMAVSDQELVWDAVDELHCNLKVHSPSAAMYDAFMQKRREIEKFLDSLKPEPEQIGYLIFIEDKPEVLEIVPNPEKYKHYHTKFVTASVIDAISDRLMNISSRPDINYGDLTNNFISTILNCAEHEFKPVGYGTNYRYQGDTVIGAALVHNDCVLHTVFFGLQNKERMGGRRLWRDLF